MSDRYVLNSLSMKLQRAGNFTQIKRESRVRGNVPARFGSGEKMRQILSESYLSTLSASTAKKTTLI